MSKVAVTSGKGEVGLRSRVRSGTSGSIEEQTSKEHNVSKDTYRNRPEVDGESSPSNPKQSVPETVFPSELDCQEFRLVWHDWEADRKKRKKPITEKAAELQLAKLAGFGLQNAIASLKQSIECGYTGVFPPKAEYQAQRPNEPKRKSEEGKLTIEQMREQGLL